MATKSAEWTPEKERVLALADRLCWLEEGQPGLTRRHGLMRAGVFFPEKYDREAARLAPTLLKPRKVYQPPEPLAMKQLSLFGD
ncbi:MAG TPA: hypothetical protein VIY48_06970 [Candidatus Paceibacterota bacterium]